MVRFDNLVKHRNLPFRMLDLSKEIDEKEGEAAKILYGQTIDYGAHPNELALMQTLKINEKEEHVEFKVVYLEGNSDQLTLALKTTAQVGVCTISLFRPIYKERYDILGVTDIIDKIKKGL